MADKDSRFDATPRPTPEWKGRSAHLESYLRWVQQKIKIVFEYYNNNSNGVARALLTFVRIITGNVTFSEGQHLCSGSDDLFEKGDQKLTSWKANCRGVEFIGCLNLLPKFVVPMVIATLPLLSTKYCLGCWGTLALSRKSVQIFWTRRTPAFLSCVVLARVFPGNFAKME